MYKFYNHLLMQPMENQSLRQQHQMSQGIAKQQYLEHHRHRQNVFPLRHYRSFRCQYRCRRKRILAYNRRRLQQTYTEMNQLSM
jgi:hypothetical protein